IVVLEVRLIVGREIIGQSKSVGGRKFQKTIAESINLGTGIKGSIAGGQIKIAVGILGRSAAAHPDAPRAAVGGGVENIGQGEGVRVVTEQPAVPGPVVTMGREADVNH